MHLAKLVLAAGVEKDALGQGGLASVRVRDDGEGAPALDRIPTPARPR